MNPRQLVGRGIGCGKILEMEGSTVNYSDFDNYDLILAKQSIERATCWRPVGCAQRMLFVNRDRCSDTCGREY